MQKVFLSLVIFATPISALAAGFSLAEQNGSGLGNAFAGGAAAAEDASTIFFNPAGMTYIQGSQLVGALNIIKPSEQFNNQGSVAGINRPLGGDGGDAGDLTLLPSFYYTMDLTGNIKFGLGVNAPFGLKTEYNADWMGRFQAVKSELKTININPALAFKVNEQLSLGFGVSAMWAKAELTNAVNFGAAEGFSSVKGDDWGFGFNLGAIYQLTSDTRIGAAYRSKIDQHLNGDVAMVRPSFIPNAGAAADGNIHADLTLPETLSLSTFSRLNNKWDLMGDITWTRWSQFKDLSIYRDSGASLGTTTENWGNTTRYSVGVNYNYSDTIKLRAGLAYDQGAVSDAYRTARIPDNDRKWLAFGAGWKITPSSKLDVGYAHLFINDASIYDNQTAKRSGLIKGSYDGDVNILSLQLTHNF